MDQYRELIEPPDDYDDETAPDITGDLSALAWQAGYGKAILDAEREASGENWADRIVDAADKMASKDLWDETP